MDINEIKKALTEATTVKAAPNRTALEEWKKVKGDYIDVPEFNTAKELINLVLKGLSPALIITGEGGNGKTQMTTEYVKTILKPEDWEYEAGYTTPLAFYKFLFANRTKKLLILDDVEGLFNDRKGIGILKNAFWDTDGKRLVFYDTTSDKLNIPSVFQLNANLIVICNKIQNKEDVNIAALLSRAINCEVNFSYNQKVDIMKRFLKKMNLNLSQQEKALLIIENNTGLVTKNFNFRTLQIIVALIKHDPQQAEALFKEIVEIDEAVLAFLEVSKLMTTEHVKVQQFKEKTGLSQRTYYRLKKRFANLPLKTDVTIGIKTEGGIKNDARTTTTAQL